MTFYIANAGCKDYIWSTNGGKILDVGDGSTSIDVIWDAPQKNASASVTLSTCFYGDSGTFSSSKFDIKAKVNPSVEIYNQYGLSTCEGKSIELSAEGKNLGDFPTFQWYVNNEEIAKTKENPFNISELTEGTYEISVKATSSMTCVANSPTSAPVNVTIKPSLSTLVLEPAPQVCEGEPITFIANGTNLGSTPTYNWYIDNIPHEEESEKSSITTTLSAGNHSVYASVKSSEECVNEVVYSNTIKGVVLANISPSMTIVPDKTSVCDTEEITFTAEANGTISNYQWIHNDSPVSTASSYTEKMHFGDQISLQANISRSENCFNSGQVTVNSPAINIIDNINPSVHITATNTTICQGENEKITFTAIPSDISGASVAYSWYVSDIEQANETASTFSSTNLSNGDMVKCIITADGSCLTNNTSESNEITITTESCPPTAPTISPTVIYNNGSSIISWQGNPSPEVAWYWQGTDNNGTNASNSSSTYTVTTSGRYYLRTRDISSGVWSDTSAYIDVEVISCLAPEASNSVICNVSNEKIQAITLGNNIIGHRWYSDAKGLDLLPKENIIENPQSTSYISEYLPDTLYEDIIIYYVSSVCFNTIESELTPIIVKVSPKTKPLVTISSNIPSTGTNVSAHICEGDTVSFTAHPNGTVSGNYSWILDDISYSTSSNTFITENYVQGSTLSVLVTIDEDNAQCMAGGKATAELQKAITVISPEIMLNEEALACQCSAEFTAVSNNLEESPTYHWFIDNNEVASGKQLSTFAPDSISIGTHIVRVDGTSACLDSRIVSSDVVPITIICPSNSPFVDKPSLCTDSITILIDTDTIPLFAIMHSIANDSITLDIQDSDSICINWGNDNIMKYASGTITGKPSGTIQIYGRVTKLNVNNDSLIYFALIDKTHLKELNCRNNFLHFSTLPKPSNTIETYIYEPQAPISLSKDTFGLYEPINLRTLYSVAHNSSTYNTNFVWKNENGSPVKDIDTTSNGIFAFNNSGTFYCEMTNDLFSGLTLKTNSIYVKSIDIKDSLINQISTDSYISILPSGTKNVHFTVATKHDNTPIMIVGKKDTAVYIISPDIHEIFTNSADTIKIFGDSIHSFDANNQLIQEIDISNYTALEELNCANNNLQRLNIGNNKNLQIVNCANNCLSISSLPIPPTEMKYSYIPQRDYQLPRIDYSTSDTIDLGKEYIKNDSITQFLWYANERALIKDVDYTQDSTGKFSFLKECKDSIHCIMQNPIFPELSIRTSNIYVCNAKPEFVVESGCSPLIIDNLKYNALQTEEFLWILDKTDSLQNVNPDTLIYIGETAPKHSISLQVTSQSGCSRTLKQNFKVYNTPVAEFEISQGVPYTKEKLLLKNQSNTYGIGVQSFEWRHDTIRDETAYDSLVLLYDSTGIYTTELYVELENGCKDSITGTLEIFQKPDSITISSDTTILCNNDDIISIILDSTLYDSIQWFANGEPIQKSVNERKLIVNTDRTYKARLYGYNSVYATNSITVSQAFVQEPKIYTKKDSICKGESSLLSVGFDDAMYKWFIGDSIIDSTENNITVYDAGTYNVEVTVNSCTKSDSATITVLNMPQKPFITVEGYKEDACMGKIITMKAVVSKEYTVQWYHDNTLYRTDTNELSEILSPGEYYVKNVNDKCIATSDVQVISYTTTLLNPSIDYAFKTNCLLQCNIKNADEYRWYFNNSLIDNATKYQYGAGENFGTYRVAVRNQEECFSFSSPLIVSEELREGSTVIYDIADATIRLYPNPTTAKFTLEIQTSFIGKISVSVYNALGMKLLNKEIENYSTKISMPFNLQNFGKGIYYIDVIYGNTQTREKLIIE